MVALEIGVFDTERLAGLGVRGGAGVRAAGVEVAVTSGEWSELPHAGQKRAPESVSRPHEEQ